MSNTPALESCLVSDFVPSKKGGEVQLPTWVHCHVANSTMREDIAPTEDLNKGITDAHLKRHEQGEQEQHQAAIRHLGPRPRGRSFRGM